MHTLAKVCILLTSVTVAHLTSKYWTVSREWLIVRITAVALNEAL
jgi:hypothetical protein